MLVEGAGFLQVLVVRAGSQVAGRDQLVESRRAEVGRLLGHDETVDDVVGSDHPAEAEARDESLGEGTEHDDPLGIHRIHRRKAFSRETDVLVRRILDDQQIVFLGHLHGVFALIEGHRLTRRVLEVRDRIEEFRLLARRTENVAGFVKAAVVTQAVRLPLIRPEGLERAQIGRKTADHHVARIDEHAGDQVEGLLRSRRDHNILDGNVKPFFAFVEFGYLLAERNDTVGGTVLEGGIALLVEHFLHNGFEIFQREGFRIGEATGKGDDFGAGRDAEQVTDLGAAHAQGIVRKQRGNIHNGLRILSIVLQI